MNVPLPAAPAFDDEGYTRNAFDEVIPGLVQGDTTFEPRQMFALGFDALFDLCGMGPRRRGSRSCRTCSSASTMFRGSRTRT